MHLPSLGSLGSDILERQRREAEEFDDLNRQQKRAVRKILQTEEVRKSKPDPRIKKRQMRKRKKK
jgi:hypothetical protein